MSIIQKIFQLKGKIQLSKNINEMKIQFNEYKETIYKKNNNTNIIPHNTNKNNNNNIINIKDNNNNNIIILNDKNSHHTTKLMDNKHLINLKTNEYLKT